MEPYQRENDLKGMVPFSFAGERGLSMESI